MGVIKKILPYGAFCSLTEYEGLEAFMHISEVAPRWIKNIHEFISEGQKYVLKVHHIDLAKKQVDVSIKRVSEEEKKTKLAMLRDEKKITKMLEVAISNSKIKLTEQEVRKKIEDLANPLEFFEQLSEGENKLLDQLDLPKQLKTELIEIAKKSIKKSVVEIKKIMKLICYEADGIELIKQTFKPCIDKAEIIYLGAPNYQITLKAGNFKDGEKQMKKLLDEVEKIGRKNNCDFSIEEEE